MLSEYATFSAVESSLLNQRIARAAHVNGEYLLVSAGRQEVENVMLRCLCAEKKAGC